MSIVDTHCHVSSTWYEPVEALLYHMDQNEVAQAVLVQYMGQYNNDYQFECVKRYPGRFGSLVLVDANRADAPEQLARLAEQGAVGVRLPADTRSPGDDPLAIWRKAEALGLPVSCGGNLSRFADDAFAALVQAVPKLPIIIEHLGGGNQPGSDDPPYPQRQKVYALARFPNVYIKIHGLGEFSRRNMPVTGPFPFEQPIPPFLDMAYEAFGPERIMWGSDYPPVSGREGYANSLRLTQAHFAAKPPDALAQMFGGTANAVFRLDAIAS